MLPSHKQQLVGLIENACAHLGATGIPVVLDRPKVEAHGDIATNVALQIAKAQKKNPREVAAEIATTMRFADEFSSLLDTVEVA
ncbi:MAG TPA: arginine--tRNA ligase, partial [Burkholderiaceae bacterium]|nr:arginine--tRNA ligase [Burkholderiaceae bacterium]